jgi:hypothetical protein
MFISSFDNVKDGRGTGTNPDSRGAIPRYDGLFPLHGIFNGDAMQVASDVGLLTEHIRPVCVIEGHIPEGI